MKKNSKKDLVTIGIDVGGTTTRLVSYSSRRGVLRGAEHATPKNARAFFLALRNHISEVVPSGKAKISGIGMGLAAVIDSKTGQVLAAPNLKFLQGADVLKFLKLASPHAVLVNDAVAIANGELQVGAARGAKNALLLAIGTGIGGAIIVDGKIYKGQGSAGQLGHVILDSGKFFESLAAGKTVVRGSAAEFKRVGKYLGQALASFVNVLDPELIVLSGGFMDDRAERFIGHAEKVMRSLVLSPASRDVRIVGGQLGDLAGAIGAALLAQQEPLARRA